MMPEEPGKAPAFFQRKDETRPFKVMFRITYREREIIRREVLKGDDTMADWLRKRVMKGLT